MRRWLIVSVVVLFGLPVILLLSVMGIANTESGRTWIEQAIPELTSGAVRLQGLAGHFPDALRMARVEVADSAGVWLSLEQFAVDWSPSRLVAGTVDIQRLSIERIAIDRRPLPSPTTRESKPPSLPVRVMLHSLRIDRLVLAPAVIGPAATLAVEGQANITALDRINGELTLHNRVGEGRYHARFESDPATLHARLDLAESAQGLLSTLAQLPDVGAISAHASLDGPRSALDLKLALTAGALRAAAEGALNLPGQSADLRLNATAPAMRPRPNLGWQSLSLQAGLNGPWLKPQVSAHIMLLDLEAAGARFPKTTAALDGDAGALHLRGESARITLPGRRPELLQATPLRFAADARLDAETRPVDVTLQHPLLSAELRVTTAPSIAGELRLKLPELAPWAGLADVDMRGQGGLNAQFSQQAQTTHLAVDGQLAIVDGRAPLPGLAGPAATFGASLNWRGAETDLTRLAFDGKALHLTGHGRLAGNRPTLDWAVNLTNLATVAPKLSGQASARGRISGEWENLAVVADLRGDLAAVGWPRQALDGQLRLTGWPHAPNGQLTAQGVLAGSPLRLSVTARREGNTPLRIVIDHADWKSAHAQGGVTLVRGTPWPIGRLELRMGRLDDLQAVWPTPLRGGFSAILDATPQRGNLRVDAQNIGLPGAEVGQAQLALAMTGSPSLPVIDGQLTLAALSAAHLTGSARVEASGPMSALNLQLAASGQNPAGIATSLRSAAQFDLPAQRLQLASLETTLKNTPLVRLLTPATLDYGRAIAVDRLQLGLGKARLEVAGRISPRLDMTLDLNATTRDLVPLVPIAHAVGGALQATARLTGTPNRPVGTVALEVSGLQWRGLPAARWTTQAELAGTLAHIDSHLDAGPTSSLKVTGQLPLERGGEFDLQAQGALDLTWLDPLLTAQGLRLRGQVALNSHLTGTPTAPHANGSLRLAEGEFRDYVHGARLDHIAAQVQAEGDSLRLVRCEGRAGPGTFALTGTLGLLAADRTVDLKFTAYQARPIANDHLSVDINADLGLRGQWPESLAAAGNLRIQRAEINLPERLPANIAVLDVRRPGAAPEPPVAPGPVLGLDIAIVAPERIFVRGRGVDAELGGSIHLHGTTAHPEPDGRFELRRGQFTLAGRTLEFSKGVVNFNGSALDDPTLDFSANSTANNITATLKVGGSVQKPKISLSSVPELPPDEVLAQLLFGHGTLSLSPFEMAQIATAVASLTGVTSGAGIGDPLDMVRKRLGLDRLALGGGTGGAPSLEAGRYVAPGIYVGARQGVTGTGTQATVRIDIAKDLKLEASVGTGSANAATSGSAAGGNTGTNSIGVIYHFDY